MFVLPGVCIADGANGADEHVSTSTRVAIKEMALQKGHTFAASIGYLPTALPVVTRAAGERIMKSPYNCSHVLFRSMVVQ